MNKNISDKYGEITNIHFSDEILKQNILNKTEKNFEDFDIFLKCLSLCSSVIVEKDENGNIKYHASSIDEKALLNGARYLGYIFLGKDNEGNFLLEINEKIQKFVMLNVIEFDSERKRMSVIVKDLQTQKIILLCKGADDILRDLTSQNKEYFEENERQITELSTKGLRNLNVAYRYIEEKEYREWDVIFKVKIIKIFFINKKF